MACILYYTFIYFIGRTVYEGYKLNEWVSFFKFKIIRKTKVHTVAMRNCIFLMMVNLSIQSDENIEIGHIFSSSSLHKPWCIFESSEIIEFINIRSVYWHWRGNEYVAEDIYIYISRKNSIDCFYNFLPFFLLILHQVHWIFIWLRCQLWKL